MADDLNVYKINKVRKTPEITILPPFAALRKKKKQNKEEERKKKRSAFKDNFLKRFKLDENKFSINLIKKDDKWFVEIYNRKTKSKFYHDYDTVCNILDISCKLPTMVGVNVDKKT